MTKKKIDKLKLIHWLNVRKTTFDILNEKIKDKINYSVSKDNLDELDDYAIDKIAEFLNIQNCS